MECIVMLEIWKPITGYEGLYECSNMGNIKSLDRIVLKKNNIYEHKKGTTIIPQLNKNGYLQVSLWKNGRRKMKYVHKIIAENFHNNSNFDKKQTVNHKDGNKQNNKTSNLEWTTFSENNKHSYSTLKRCKNKTGGRKKRIVVKNIVTGFVFDFESITMTAKHFQISWTQTSRYIYNNNTFNKLYKFYLIS